MGLCPVIVSCVHLEYYGAVSALPFVTTQISFAARHAQALPLTSDGISSSANTQKIANDAHTLMIVFCVSGRFLNSMVLAVPQLLHSLHDVLLLLRRCSGSSVSAIFVVEEILDPDADRK